MANLGGRATYLEAHQVRMGDREPISDVARVLLEDGPRHRHLYVRARHRHRARPLGHHSRHQRALRREHPCQALADLLTLVSTSAGCGVKLAYVGDGNNVARALAYASVLAGIEFRSGSPAGFELGADDLERARCPAADDLTRDPAEAVHGAQAVYTDVWTSMGQEAEAQARLEHFAGFQVNAELLDHAPGALVMHDLPAHRGEEITDDAIESERSVVFDQAENRVFAQQAVLILLAGHGARGAAAAVEGVPAPERGAPMPGIPQGVQEVFARLDWSAVIDILLISLSIYWVLLLLRGTTAMTVLRGAAVIFAAAFVLSRMLDLQEGAGSSTLVAGIVLSMAVVFQPGDPARPRATAAPASARSSSAPSAVTPSTPLCTRPRG
ncbi:MAG: hypothetical protein U0360_06230 [Dehalococcoidia bacterium]